MKSLTQYNAAPKNYILFPEVIIPYGVGTAADLDSIYKDDGNNFLNSDDTDVKYGEDKPLIGVTKLNGKTYIIFKYMNVLSPRYKYQAIMFDDPVKKYSFEYIENYVLCDITDRYGKISSRLDFSKFNIIKLFKTPTSSDLDKSVRNAFHKNEAIFIDRHVDVARSIYIPDIDGNYKSIDGAKVDYVSLMQTRVELYTIDWGKYKQLVEKQ